MARLRGDLDDCSGTTDKHRSTSDPRGRRPDRKVIALSLNAHDRQVLALIEEELAGADPRFAAKLSAFSRLTEGTMPEREQIRGRRRPSADRPSANPSSICGLPPGRQASYKLFYWIAVAMALSVSLAIIYFALISGHAKAKPRAVGSAVRRTALWGPPQSGRYDRIPSPLS
jgi:hypothetical protein